MVSYGLSYNHNQYIENDERMHTFTKKNSRIPHMETVANSFRIMVGLAGS